MLVAFADSAYVDDSHDGIVEAFFLGLIFGEESFDLISA